MSDEQGAAPPVPDRAGRLIARFLALADPAFVPPPFDAAIAEEVLGASGRPLTPHRRLLERMNGAYLHHHALHVFGACERPAWHGLRPWNAPATWRDAYGPPPTEGLTFFAEDAFGDQFAYTGRGGEVVSFEAELGRVVPCAASFVDWLEEMIERPASLLPLELLHAAGSADPAGGIVRAPAPGEQLCAWPPLFSPEAQAGVSIGHVDAVEAMRFRGELARRVSGLPPGTRLRIELDDEQP